jgi:hypothetical protein
MPKPSERIQELARGIVEGLVKDGTLAKAIRRERMITDRRESEAVWVERWVHSPEVRSSAIIAYLDEQAEGKS